ncbi:hypothetical protein RDABS01_038355 [Bienertia sinuspersici]
MIHNEEILEEILSRLPAKSIGRFRCVSKPWRALLSQPHFIKTHLNRINDFPFEAQSLILVTSQSNIIDDLSHIECFVGKMASCDGLTLIEDGESSLLLINPTTKEFEGLPKSPDALEPRDSFTMYGMGYDSVSDDYKIVALSYFDTDNEHEPDCTEMFVDVYSIKKVRLQDYSSVIVAFDLGEEKFGEVPPPSLVEDSEFVFSHLLMLKGCLCMFASSSDYKTDIWLMKSTDEERLVMYDLKEGRCNDIVVENIPEEYGFGGTFIESLVSPQCNIVALSYFDTDNEHEPDCTEMFVDVYSIKKGTWKRAVSSPYDHSVGHVTSGVFVDGHIHWLASKTSDYSSVIVAFDLGEEKFGEVPPPSLVEDSEFVFSHLLMLKGCLCMFASSSDYKTDIWLMKEYGVKESWTKFKIIDTDKSEFRPLCFVGMEQVVGVKDEERLVMYDLKEGRCNDIVVENIPEEYGFGGTFIESLVSPQCNVEATRND